MKVYVTKYALTEGIQEMDGEECGDGMVRIIGDLYGTFFHKEGRDWHREQGSANARAEAMRKAKIASLEKSIAKLRAMKFQ